MRPLFQRAEDQRAFERKGYVVRRLADAELPRLRDLVADVQATLRSDPRWEPRGFDELMYVEDRAKRREAQAEIEGVLAPRLAAILIEPRTMLSNVLVKAPAPADNAVPLHQDYTVVNESLGHEHVQVWLPLVDVDRTNGCLGVLPRAHRVPHPYRAQGDKTPFESFLGRAKSELMRWLSLRAGEAVFFTGRTVHASDGNRSDQPRPAVACLLTGPNAPLVHYHRVAPNRVEVFRLEPGDLRMLVPGKRPEVGRSEGFLDHGPSQVSYSDFLRIAAE